MKSFHKNSDLIIDTAEGPGTAGDPGTPGSPSTEIQETMKLYLEFIEILLFLKKEDKILRKNARLILYMLYKVFYKKPGLMNQSNDLKSSLVLTF